MLLREPEERVITEMRLKKIGYKKVDWIHLAQFRIQWRTLVSTEINSLLLCKEMNFMTSFVIISSLKKDSAACVS
jgi:hypothetical protein